MQTIAIIGTGGIGALCAVFLERAGFSVHCLLHSDYAYVKQHGLKLVTPEETLTTKLNVYKDVNEMPKCDVIFVALKTTQNDLLATLLPPLMKSETKVVLLQNGIGMEEELASIIPAQQVFGSSCHTGVSRSYPGVVYHYSGSAIDIAPLDASAISGATEVSKLLVKAGFESQPTADLVSVRWQKLVINIPLNGLAVVLNSNTPALVAEPATFELICAMMKEIIKAALICGAKIDANFYEERRKSLHKYRTTHIPSSKQDYDQKKPLELKALYENPLAIAAGHDCEMPLVEMLYQQLSYLQVTNLG